MRNRAFRWISKVSTEKPWSVLFIGLALTIFMAFLASRLRLEMTWYDIVPKDDPSLKSYRLIMDKMGNEGGIIVAVENPVPESLLAISEEVRDSLSRFNQYLRSIVLKEPEEFFVDHGLMLLDTALIERVSQILQTANLDSFLVRFNDDLEGEYIEKEENLETYEFEASMSLTALEDFLYGVSKYLKGGDRQFLNLGTKELILGPLYFKSLDNKMILISLTPNFTISEMEPVKKLVELTRGTIKRIEKRHKNTKILDTGIYSIEKDEDQTARRDMNVSTVVSFVLVILLFLVGFRIIQAPVLAGIPLFFGIIWDLGLTWLFLGRLNILTAFVGAILIGLGIDYSIHILQASAEKEGVKTALLRVGNGLLTGALTTAVAFFSLTTTSYGALKELGIVTGTGVLTTATATIFFLPALIQVFGKRLTKKDMSAQRLGRIAHWIRGKGLLFPIFLILLIFLSPLAIKRIKTVANPIELEAPGLASVANQDTVVKRFGMSTDYIMVPTSSLNEADSIARIIKKVPGVSFVEGIHLYYPPLQVQRYKIPFLREIQERAREFKIAKLQKFLLLKELNRLKDNVIELRSISFIGGLDRVYEKCEGFLQSGLIDSVMERVRESDEKALQRLNQEFFSTLKPLILKASSPVIITFDDIPPQIRDRFVSSDGSLYVTNVFSRGDVWKDVGKGTVMDKLLEKTSATGLPILMRVLWEVGKRETKKALLIVFATIFLILVLDFRNLKSAVIAFLPVLFAFVLTFGLMGILGVPFNFVNVLALPVIIGIGIDDSVHIIHRYLNKPSVFSVFSRIGRAIFFTSVTTMAAFGSLLLGKYKGFPTFGAVVLIGVALAFLVTLTLLPSLLKYLRKEEN